jgi:hypothetical protein
VRAEASDKILRYLIVLKFVLLELKIAEAVTKLTSRGKLKGEFQWKK